MVETQTILTKAPYAAAVGFILFLYFIAYPVLHYFKDSKGQ